MFSKFCRLLSISYQLVAISDTVLNIPLPVVLTLMTGSPWLSLLEYVQGTFEGYKKFPWGFCLQMMSSCTILLRKEVVYNISLHR